MAGLLAVAGSVEYSSSIVSVVPTAVVTNTTERSLDASRFGITPSYQHIRLLPIPEDHSPILEP